MAIIEKMEAQLRPVETPMVNYPAKYITQVNGDKLVNSSGRTGRCSPYSTSGFSSNDGSKGLL